jgi:hypothetical protein
MFSANSVRALSRLGSFRTTSQLSLSVVSVSPVFESLKMIGKQGDGAMGRSYGDTQGLTCRVWASSISGYCEKFAVLLLGLVLAIADSTVADAQTAFIWSSVPAVGASPFNGEIRDALV